MSLFDRFEAAGVTGKKDKGLPPSTNLNSKSIPNENKGIYANKVPPSSSLYRHGHGSEVGVGVGAAMAVGARKGDLRKVFGSDSEGDDSGVGSEDRDRHRQRHIHNDIDKDRDPPMHNDSDNGASIRTLARKSDRPRPL